MKLVVQRVNRAQVKVVGKNEPVGKIDKGLFVLIGIEENDTEKEAESMAGKLVKLRIMSDREGKMNLSVNDVNGAILVVSQFTLLGDASKGNRPSFIKAARPELAVRIYTQFVEKLRKLNTPVATGAFGEYMEISAILDGPVTILF